MFQPYYAFIGYRYTRAKRKNHFISFIALTAMIGIALGVTVLITVLSVMNGFGREIRKQMLSGAPHITIQSLRGEGLADWKKLVPPIKQVLGHELLDYEPYIQGQGMLLGKRVQGVLVKGVLPNEKGSYAMQPYLLGGDIKDFKDNSFGIYLGKELAFAINVDIGDKITLMIPEVRLSLVGITPRMKQFTVLGIFSMGYLYDTAYAFVHLNDAAKLFRMGDEVTGIQLKIRDERDSRTKAEDLNQALGPTYRVFDWTQSNGSYLAAVQMEKTVMTFILLLIVAIAAFNLVSGLVMLVTDKRPDIAILRTLGATRREIMSIFMIQGTLIGCLGTALGLIFGLVLALNVTEWVAWIEKTFQVQLFYKEVYSIGFLPSQLQVRDVIVICAFSLGFSFLSTLYPAYRATKIQAAEALRYE